uniref:Uncharacterized protein n=1 Tax=Sphaerodactylus townsendi TaxID=933632 RepID=A0ACB8FN01_9SAUR
MLVTWPAFSILASFQNAVDELISLKSLLSAGDHPGHPPIRSAFAPAGGLWRRGECASSAPARSDSSASPVPSFAQPFFSSPPTRRDFPLGRGGGGPESGSDGDRSGCAAADLAEGGPAALAMGS